MLLPKRQRQIDFVTANDHANSAIIAHRCRQSQSPYIFFYLAVAVVGAKISFIKSVSIFMKRETLQKRHKQSNLSCLYAFLYVYH